MATIEQLEIQLAGKLSLINRNLNKFHENIGKIGNVVGKNPTYVHTVLLEKYDEIKNSYESAINMNTGFLEGLINRADKIISVLDEVMAIIDRIDNASGNEAIDVKNEVNEAIDRVAEELESGADTIDSAVGANVSKYVIPGAISFVVLRYILKLGQTVSLASSAAIAMILKKK